MRIDCPEGFGPNEEGWLVKPWVGAAVAAAAIFAAPSVALAGEDDPAQVQFKLPNAEAVHEFERLGLNIRRGGW